jgi:molybdopterin molybdotransferase
VVTEVAESVGWTTIFHKVKIKPGKPIYFARRQRQLLFGLPGNPLSAAVTCAVFVLPALKKMAGCRRFQLRLTPARLGSTPIRESDRMLIWPGTIRQDGTGTVAEFSPKKSSAALSALLGSDGLIFQTASDGSDASTTEIETVRWEQMLSN